MQADEQRDDTAPEYEAPVAEDLDTPAGPSVTAAGAGSLLVTRD